MTTQKRRVIYVSDEEWTVWRREAKSVDRTVSDFIRSHLMGYVRAAQREADVALVDVPVIEGVATLPDGRIVESPSEIVRVPIPTERFNSQPFKGPIPKVKPRG